MAGSREAMDRPMDEKPLKTNLGPRSPKCSMLQSIPLVGISEITFSWPEDSPAPFGRKQKQKPKITGSAILQCEKILKVISTSMP